MYIETLIEFPLVGQMAVRPATGDKETGALTSKSYDTIGGTGVIAIVVSACCCDKISLIFWSHFIW